MRASDHTNSSIVFLQTDIAIEVVIIDQNSGAACLPCIRPRFMIIAISHTHLHLYMERVTCPVRHVVIELVVVHDDVWVVIEAELGALDVNYTSGSSNVFSKVVSCKYHWTFIAFDHESSHIFECIYHH